MSLLARIYGIFTVATSDLSPINLIIMQNTAVLQNSFGKDFEFDLKGSLVGRRAPYNLRNPNTRKERNKTLKDANFLEI